MNPRFLDYYNSELAFMREMGAEFARDFPKVAGRLGLEGAECKDPYVERLLEGFGFLAARVHMRLDAEFPRFTRRLLETVYPHYLAPTPSMAVVQLRPDLTEGSLAEGFLVPRDSALRSSLGRGEQTACEYRTAHDVTLWPLELAEAEYFTHLRDLNELNVPNPEAVRAGLRLKLRTTAGLTFDKIALDRLPVYLLGSDGLPMRLYQQIHGTTHAVVVRPPGGKADWHEVLPAAEVRRVGFAEEQAAIPHTLRSFHGYRLLHEYFTFPQRFLFAEFGGLRRALGKCQGNELDLLVLFDRHEPDLQRAFDADNFGLFCAPAINVFPKSADRIHLDTRSTEYHIVPDRTRPMDFEVYSVESVVGHGTSADAKQRFRPFYAVTDAQRHDEGAAFYTVDRVKRVASARQQRSGPRSNYGGTEVFVSIVDADEAPYRPELKQLEPRLLCTNRDLPLQLSLGSGRTDFTLESGAPVDEIRVVAGPSPPRPSHAEGETAWRLISHLSLNYLSLVDNDEDEGASGLRELLSLYTQDGDSATTRQVEGLRSVSSQPITRRLPVPGPITFGRGLEITLTFDASAFEGTGVFLLGAVLEQFFSKYVSINSFTETVVKTIERGEIIRWPARGGLRQTL